MKEPHPFARGGSLGDAQPNDHTRIAEHASTLQAPCPSLAEFDCLYDSPRAMRTLRVLRVPTGPLVSVFGPIAGMIGHGRIQTDSRGFFELADDGYERIVFGIRDMVTGDVVDLIAINPSDPAEHWRRYGALDFLPNSYPVSRAVATNGRLILQPNVIAWLRASFCGVVALDWRQAWWMLRGDFELATRNLDHGLAVEKLLRGPDLALPRITVSVEAIL